MTGCDRLPQLLRMRDAGEAEAIEHHLAQCWVCAGAWRDLAELTALGQALPEGLPDARRRESLRTRILAEAAAPARPARSRWVALAAAAAIVAAVVGAQLLPSSPTPLGRITSAPGAVFSVTKADGDELVALDEGRITIRVPRLAPGQRFVVITDDAEVEVQGTVFTVEAAGGRLQAVEVEEGLVEVRPAGADTVRLRAAQRWARARRGEAAGQGTAGDEVEPRELPGDGPREEPELGAPPREEDPPIDTSAGAAAARPRLEAPRAPPAPATSTRRSPTDAPPIGRPDGAQGPPAGDGAAGTADQAPDAAPPASDVGVEAEDRPPSPQTRRFDEGWRALRADRPADAAPAFAEAAALGGPLTADARWWHAVALGRAGRDAEARQAVTHFIEAYPGSPRRAEASVMLGWLDFAGGRMDLAQRSFSRGFESPRETVRAAAQAGLDAVAIWRARRDGRGE